MTKENSHQIMHEITSFDTEKLKARSYKINDRKFKDLKEITERSEDYKSLFFPYGEECVVYSGAEHNPKNLTKKLPNITFLPNYEWQNYKKRFILTLGSTLGHKHIQAEKGDNREFQEIYEFLGYGAMILRNKNGTTLHILAPKEKIIVGTEDSMTIFNLQTEPLITLDYANPNMNSANKVLEKNIGPLMMIQETPIELDFSEYMTQFRLNRNYVTEKIIKTESTSKNLINVPAKLGRELYSKLSSNSDYKEEFKQLGINLSFESNIPKHFEKEFTPSLLELAVMQNKILLSALKINEEEFR